MTTENYFAAEDAIIERIEQNVPDLKKVSGWVDLDSAFEASAATPAAVVVYLGDRTPDSGQAAALVEQKWCVALTVRAPQTAATQKAAREQAGTLITQIVKCLHGWSPAARHSEMVLSGGVQVRFYRGGIAVFGIPFAVRRPVLVR